MTTEIHAHNVLNLLHEKPMTRSELVDFLAGEYGAEARFHTCKLNNLDIDALLTFFFKMEKVVQDGDKIMTNMARVCSH
ncbi:YecH family protein [Vibrio makurazakiensis]|uniref:YecH family metal-binding protein n=1 Tax=Vibrio makurazakiensis TaxID=2910250 RepID=UPI003D13FC11